MSELLFVYGSLMPELGDAPFGRTERQRLSGESALIGPATIAATLYDFGNYPGALVPPVEAQDRIHGTLLHLPNSAATFHWLDAYEDYDSARPDADNLYLRQVLPVTLDSRDSKSEMAWVYVMWRVPPEPRRIATGKWHAPSPKLDV